MSTATLALLVVILSCIGAATVARWLIEAVIGLWRFVREAHRSFIQARRIERIGCGRGGRLKLTVFMRVWADLFGDRCEVAVRGYRLPYDVRQPIARVW